jgi:ABC-type antimicrobial peptide transport system permease subunit
VAVINNVLAERYFPGENPLGKQINLDKPATIVGVVRANVQSRLADKPFPEVDRPYLQLPDVLTTVDVNIVVRSSVSSASLIPALRAAVRQVDPSQSVFRTSTMNQVISESLSDEKLNFTLLAIFALEALSLSAAGLFGVMAHSVTLRTKEIGVRMAIGATRTSVLRSVLQDAGKLVISGTVIGVVGSLICSQLLRRFLFGVSPSDLTTYAVISVVLTLTGLCAAYFPARRAAGIDPMLALRYQ